MWPPPPILTDPGAGPPIAVALFLEARGSSVAHPSLPPWEAGSSAEWRALTTPSSALAAASEIAFVIWHSSCTTGGHDEPSSKEHCEVEEWSNAHRHSLGVCPRRGTHEL